MGLNDEARGHVALLGKEVWRERQRPEAWVVAAAVVWTPEQGGCGSRRRAKPASATRKNERLRGEFRTEMERLRTEMQRLKFQLLTATAGLLTVAVAVIAFLNRFWG